MQWRILNDHRALMAWTADKLAQKSYAAHVRANDENAKSLKIPATFWAGTEAEDLARHAGALPSDWVFKPNHSCGRFRIYGNTDNSSADPDWNEIADIARQWMAPDEEIKVFGHFAYGRARRLLIAEERVGSVGNPPIDVRILCFDGRSHSAFSVIGHIGDPGWSAAYLDGSLNRIRAGLIGSSELGLEEQHPIDQIRPAIKEEILRVAQSLAAPFDFVRVDLYVSENEIWLGELTTYSGSGLRKVDATLDTERGKAWRLPNLAASDPRESEWRALLTTAPELSLPKPKNV